MSADAPPPQVWPTLRAADAPGLIRFLVEVLGFSQTVVHAEGELVSHAELAWPAGGGIMLGSAREDDAWALRPGTFGAYVVTDDPESVYRRAVDAGAEIAKELHTTDYGSRDFTVRDPEGNWWAFGTYRGEAPRLDSPDQP